MKLFCWAFILSVAIVSPVFLDLYPFSVFPMFSDNASQYVVVEIEDINGNQLKTTDYGLYKVRLANRSQRYGRNLGPCYFDNHETIKADQVQAFLVSNFPDQQYPIVLRHWKRGFDQATRTIKNLTEPREFRIEQVSVGITGREAKPSGIDDFSDTLIADHSNTQAKTSRK